MCNACYFVCCALDVFEGCGCEGLCGESDCWPLDEDDRGDDDDWRPEFDCAAARPARFVCEPA